MDPGRHMAEEVRENMIKLAKAKGCGTIPGARFKLVAQRFKVKHNGKNSNADAYGVQCMRIDAQAADAMMKTMHRDTSTYVKNKLRKEKPKAYVSALRIQIKYITTVKVIPLVGITRTTMTNLRPILLKNKHIHHVVATPKINLIGRWDIIMDEENLGLIEYIIDTNHANWQQRTWITQKISQTRISRLKP
jgi:hypothetical protein